MRDKCLFLISLLLISYIRQNIKQLYGRRGCCTWKQIKVIRLQIHDYIKVYAGFFQSG
jgi:hypothetical protein